jgi:hypothetical protein
LVTIHGLLLEIQTLAATGNSGNKRGKSDTGISLQVADIFRYVTHEIIDSRNSK